MMIIIHALEDCAAAKLPPDVWTAYKSGKIITLAGTPGAFDETTLPDSEGRVGGPIIRMTHLQPQSSAFRILADCARLFHWLLAEHSGGLRYFRTGGSLLSDAELESEPASVAWISSADGAVTAFRLAPLVASSPLLMSLTSDLAAHPIADERRFAFLAAAFKGV